MVHHVINMSILYILILYIILKDSINSKDRPKSGRPRLTDHQTNEQIVETYITTEMKQVLPFSSEVGVSARTVVRRLNFVGLYAHRPALKPKHEQTRMG